MSEETQEKKTKDQQNDRGGNQCGDSNFKRKNRTALPANIFCTSMQDWKNLRQKVRSNSLF